MVGPYDSASPLHDGGARVKLKLKRSMVALLTALLVFGSTPAQLWAEGAEGIAQAVDAATVETAEKLDGADHEKAAFEDAKAGDAAEKQASNVASEQTPSEEPAVEKSESTVSNEVTTPADQQVAATADQKTVEVSIKVIGPNADGENQVWASNAHASVVEGTTAATLSEQLFKDAGLDANCGEMSWGWSLNTITSPYTGEKLGYDGATGKYWQLFVNGEVSGKGAGEVELKASDEIVWFYSAYGDSLPSDGDVVTPALSSTIEVIGADAAGNAQRWAAVHAYAVPEGTTAAQLTEELFRDTGIDADYGMASWGWSLNTITSPYTGEKLGYDGATGKYWQLFINGKLSSVGAGDLVLTDGDSIQWRYSAYDESGPSDGDLVVDPTAPRPSDTASWAGFGNGGSTVVEGVTTPTESTTAKWAQDLKAEGDYWISVGDPIIVGDYIYVTTSTDLIKINRATGAIQKRIKTGGKTAYFSRPVYADGLIIVPSDDGSIAAFTADSLTCVWKTAVLEKPALGGKYQANSTLTVANGCVYVPFEAGAGSTNIASAGALVCVRISDGKVLWTNTTVKQGESTGEGYYWAGAAVSGSELVIGDEGGRVSLIDGGTGKTVSSVSLGMPCRATVVSAGTQDGKQVFLAVGRQPATLFKIVREGDVLKIAGKVEFAATSTVTPAVVGKTAYVCGATQDYKGVLATVDLVTMKVENSYKADANIQSSPLVSVQGDDTYVYFTCNGMPGALYRYTSSTHAVEQIYTPAEGAQNYCTASVIADAQGNLYYSNDSGTLFALAAAAGHKVIYDAAGGSSVSPVAIAHGKKLLAPEEPVREGYTFAGWYTAEGARWDFGTPVTADMVLTARWEKVEKPTPVNPTPSNPAVTPANPGSQGGNDNTAAAPAGGAGQAPATLTQAVAPAATPVAAQQQVETKDASDDQAKSEDDTAQAVAEDSVSTLSRSAKAAAKSEGLPVAVIAGAVGVVGVIAAGAWLATLKRRA